MKRAIFAKYCGRAFSTSPSSILRTISSSSPSSIILQLETKKNWVLWAAFIGGFSTHAYKNFRETNEYWGRVNKMYNDYHKRKEEVDQRYSRLLDKERKAGRI